MVLLSFEATHKSPSINLYQWSRILLTTVKMATFYDLPTFETKVLHYCKWNYPPHSYQNPQLCMLT